MDVFGQLFSIIKFFVCILWIPMRFLSHNALFFFRINLWHWLILEKNTFGSCIKSISLKFKFNCVQGERLSELLCYNSTNFISKLNSRNLQNRLTSFLALRRQSIPFSRVWLWTILGRSFLLWFKIGILGGICLNLVVFETLWRWKKKSNFLWYEATFPREY